MTEHAKTQPPFWAVIPAGGSGTRLWPLSRAARPKYLLRLTGTRSLLQQTFDRVCRVTSADRVLVICGAAHAEAIRQQLPELPTDHVVVEPSPASTGPALALAAAIIAEREPGAVMGSFAADHDIADPDAFEQATRAAYQAALPGALVTIGIEPSRPETGYGYIERTDEVVCESPFGTAFRAARFVEKPNETRAQEFLESGKFLWNAGMFVWETGAFLDELERFQPELTAGVRKIAQAWTSWDRGSVLKDVWETFPTIAIEPAVVEGSNHVAVVPAEMGWSDVGDFNSLGELIQRDDVDNSVKGELIQIATKGSVVWSETGRPVAMIGLENLVVVDTPDVLLVADRSQAQEVKKLVEQMRKELS